MTFGEKEKEAKTKFGDWRELVSDRAVVEIKLLEMAEKYLYEHQLEELNELIMKKDYNWAGFIFGKITAMANQGYKEMKGDKKP